MKLFEDYGCVVEPIAWYAIRVRTRSELQVASTLESRGVQSYVPTVASARRWADRAKVIRTALFPGYVFSRFDANKRLPVLTAPNVIQILGLGKLPVPVPDSEIENLFVIGQANLPQSAVEMPTEGDMIRIVEGPLAGVEGVLVKAKSGTRLLVSVTILKRAVAVEVEAEWVRAIDGTETFLKGAAA